MQKMPAVVPRLFERANNSTYVEFEGVGDSDEKYRRLLVAGNGLMLGSLITTIGTIVVCYIVPELFSFSVQLFGHMAMILALTGIKIGYLMRCIGRHGLGEFVL